MRSLRAKLAVGAAVIGLIGALASGLTIHGMALMSAEVQVAVTAEKRIQRYTTMAGQVGSLLVILYEAAQSGVGADIRTARLEGLTENIRRSFAEIRADLDQDVGAAAVTDIDEQSRRATRSIGIARMEALFETTLDRFDRSDGAQPSAARLQGQINSFSMGFDPLLNEAISLERRTREKAIARVDELRRRLSRIALAVGFLSIVLVLGFYLFLVRPQFSRLDKLRAASEEIGRQNFAVDVTDRRDDEIGQVFQATHRMAGALASRKADVEREWAGLNQTIADRTEALRDANDALAKTDEDRRRFFADVSHELRTPLTVILMEAELALKAGADQDGPYGVIHDRARRLNRRIDDLLRIARSESGVLTMDSYPFDLRDAADTAVADMASLLAQAGMSVSVAGANVLTVMGDANWTRQVITGLLENALRHAGDGKEILLNLDQTETTGRARVIDNGPGIPQDDLGTITQRFTQAPGSQAKSEGFGIGLALAQWVVGQQEGALTLESPVPEGLRLGNQNGTMVTVALPLHTA